MAKDKDYDERMMAREQFDRYQRARDAGHLKYVDISKKCNEYYWGEQWDKDDIAKLDAEQRPHLTVNEILPTINTVLGEQARTRADAQFKPRGGGANAEVADVLNKLYLQITDDNNMEWVESTVFEDGVIGGRGYFDIRMDFMTNIAGDIKITAEDPHDIIIDPDAKDYLPKTWKEVFKTRWLSVDDIEENYGKEAANKVRYVADDYDSLGVDSMTFQETFSNNNDNGTTPYTGGTQEDENTIRKVRVIERQHRKMRKVRCFVDNTTGDMQDVPEGIDDARAQQMAAELNLSIMARMKKDIRWTVTADQFVLFDEWSPYDDFTIVPFFAYFRRGKPFGVVENLLSPQDNLNKVVSQELHVVNTTANSGWTFESGSLIDMTRDDLERDGAKTGLVLEHARNSEPPKKILPNPIPQGLDRISMKATQFVRDISGVSESMLGYDGQEVSGVAIEKKQLRGLTQLQALFDNLNKTRHILAERILKLVQTFYTEERVVRVTNFAKSGNPTEEEMINVMTATGEILNDITLGEYSVTISSVPARDTFNDSQFAEALSLRNVGVQIPDDTVIEYSNLSQKYQVAERVRQLTGTGEPTEEQAEMQALMAELELQRTQLEMQELGAKIKDLTMKAQLNEAKALEINEDKPEQAGLEARQDAEQFQQDLQVQIMDIETRFKETREKLDTQLQIALLQKDTADKANKEKAAQQTSPASSQKSRKGLSDTASGRKAK